MNKEYWLAGHRWTSLEEVTSTEGKIAALHGEYSVIDQMTDRLEDEHPVETAYIWDAAGVLYHEAIKAVKVADSAVRMYDDVCRDMKFNREKTKLSNIAIEKRIEACRARENDSLDAINRDKMNTLKEQNRALKKENKNLKARLKIANELLREYSNGTS